MDKALTMSASPRVTVLMPVFNGEKYLREAVESILCQTFADFEFLVIDDGSTDHSADIVTSYNDQRIRLISNGRNLGLIASLNRGIDLARGEYIARMDSDDISLPSRLARQAEYLDSNRCCAMVAAMVTMMNADGTVCGEWGDDRKTPSYGEIVQFLPKANCIAHPGVMIRKSVLAAYRYNELQQASEDYDLWLRMCADGLIIDKIEESLVKYRMNPVSVTSLSKSKGPEYKYMKAKSIFLRDRILKGKLNAFVLKVFLNIFRDLFFWTAKKALGPFIRDLS